MEQRNLWTWIIVGLIVLVVIIGFVEGQVYKYGELVYWMAGLVEISIFLIGVIVGKEMAEWRHRNKT